MGRKKGILFISLLDTARMVILFFALWGMRIGPQLSHNQFLNPIRGMILQVGWVKGEVQARMKKPGYIMGCSITF